MNAPQTATSRYQIPNLAAIRLRRLVTKNDRFSLSVDTGRSPINPVRCKKNTRFSFNQSSSRLTRTFSDSILDKICFSNNSVKFKTAEPSLNKQSDIDLEKGWLKIHFCFFRRSWAYQGRTAWVADSPPIPRPTTTTTPMAPRQRNYKLPINRALAFQDSTRIMEVRSPRCSLPLLQVVS